MSQSEDLAALEQFVVFNDDLLRLEAHIGKFNLFDALGVARSEIRHSNALAFLLDPSESHGQGQQFLQAVLMDLLRSAPASLRPLSPIELDGTDLRGVDVRREWQDIDLLISCEQPRFVIALENKVDSGEHSDQLARYERAMSEAFPGVPTLHVFLTLTGAEASRPSWVSYSYADLCRVLRRVRDGSASTIGDDVRVFLDHYLSLIGNRFMSDPEIDQLSKRIYKNHRRALQLIFDRVGAPSAGVVAAVEEELLNDGRWHVYYTTGVHVDFIPADWLAWIPGGGLDFKDDPRSWLVARLDAYNGKLDFYVEVRRMGDLALRKRILDGLIPSAGEAGFPRRQSGDVSDSYTRIVGRQRVIHWGDEEPPEPTEVRKAVKTYLQAVYPRFEALRPALQRVLGVRS